MGTTEDINALKKMMKETEKNLEESNETIKKLRSSLDSSNSLIETMRETNKLQEKLIEKLKKEKQELEEEQEFFYKVMKEGLAEPFVKISELAIQHKGIKELFGGK